MEIVEIFNSIEMELAATVTQNGLKIIAIDYDIRQNHQRCMDCILMGSGRLA